MSSHTDLSGAQQHEDRLQALIDSSPLALVEFGLDTRIRLWNPAAERIFGWTREEILGRGGVPMAPADEARGERGPVRRACWPASRSPTTRPSGSARTARPSMSRSPPRRSGTRRAESSGTWSRTPTSPSARSRRNASTRSLTGRRSRSWSSISTLTSASGTRPPSASSAGRRPRSSVSGSRWCRSRSSPRATSCWRACSRRRDLYGLRDRSPAQGRDARRRLDRGRASPGRVRPCGGNIAVYADITERKAQQAELHRLNAELHARLEELAASRARIVAAGDVERKRLERNLHDGAQQRLVALALSLRLALAKLDSGPGGRPRVARRRRGRRLGLALDELRELARGIHPAVLSDQGLRAAVEGLAARAPFRSRSRTSPTSGCRSPSRRLRTT